ncbi:cobalamin biosynthesis protein CobIJ [Clostridiales bacterium]|nr:cobalamin biosynthesis protein CobIJ [Clostridiales bacterium]
MKKGKLYGVSVGPGDPELMTLKAVRIIKEADIIALPHSEKNKCTAYNIAVQAVPEIDEKEILMIPMPMTKDREKLEEAHQAGVEAVAELLKKGRTIAFLTLGDVSVYSSCQYIYQPIKSMGMETELISGVPSFCAAAARLDRPLVSGKEKLHIIPASYGAEECTGLDGVKVLMKPGKSMEQIKQLGLSICGVENCGMEGERVYIRADEIEEKQGYYSIYIVG